MNEKNCLKCGVNVYECKCLQNKILMNDLKTVQTKMILTDQKTLETIVKLVSTVEENPTLSLDRSGIFYRSMDSSHVSLLDMRLAENLFQQYEIDEEIKFSVEAKLFLKIVKALDKKQAVRIEFFKDEIKIGNKNGSTLLKISEPGSSDCPLPKIPFDVTIGSSVKDMIGVLKTVENISDYVKISTQENKTLIIGKGDQGSSEQDLYQKNGFWSTLTVESESTYSLEYLMPFLKALQKDQKMEFQYSSTKPCRIQTKLNEVAFIDFYLAPRVEN